MNSTTYTGLRQLVTQGGAATLVAIVLPGR
jgi:hypothetical protein